MRLLLAILAIIAALFLSVLLALTLRHDGGYVLLSIGQWTVETSVAFFGVFLFLLFAAFYFLVRLIIRLFRAPGQAFAASRRFQLQRSHRLLTEGLQQLAAGHWKAAERMLVKGLANSRVPSLHYIGAAQAARRLGDQSGYDNLLRQVEQLPAHEAATFKLTQAAFLLEDGQAEQARDLLLTLRDQEQPPSPRLLELLVQSYQQLGDWKSLQGLLNPIREHRVFDPAGFQQLSTQTYGGLLRDTGQQGTLDDLHKLWQTIPTKWRGDESLVIEYAGQLRDHGAGDEAETLLREALKKQWSDRLVVGYGVMGRGNVAAQLAHAEGWLPERTQDAYLLLTCGRLANRNNQPEKARDYLERSLKVQPDPDAYQELGEVLEELGQPAAALQAYRAGLRLLSGRLEAKQGAALLTAAGSGSTALVQGAGGAVLAGGAPGT
jgi:HemY protein